MKAIIYKDLKQATMVTDRPRPHLRDNYILVKVAAVAVNPTDWKHVQFGIARDGCLLGVDYAGTVEDIGSVVSAVGGWKKGDRICGFVHGGNYSNIEDGAFAEYIVVPTATAIKMPENLTFEEAATLGCGVTTVAQGLFEVGYGLGLNPPSDAVKNGETVLIYGGSSSTGSLGIQFAKTAGYKVVTTCSPRNFDLVKTRGADEVFDYKDPEVGGKINAYTNNSLKYAWDTIGTEDAARICAEALTTGEGAHFGTIRAPKLPRQDVTYTTTMAYVGIGEDYEKGGKWTCDNGEHADWQRKFWKLAEGLLASGKVKVHPVCLKNDGLKGVLDGLKELEKGNYSGQKFVYRVVETPEACMG